MATGTPNICEQDIVGYNYYNSSYYSTYGGLLVGQNTLINDAVYIDSRATPNFTGTIQLSIGAELNMTAVFTATGTTTLNLTVLPNQLVAIPITVKATNCKAPNVITGLAQFVIDYATNPAYGVSYESEGEPVLCEQPTRRLKLCRFEVVGIPKCVADFQEKISNVTGTGEKVIHFDIGQNPICTGDLTVTFDKDCSGVNFKNPQPATNGVTWDYSFLPGSLVAKIDDSQITPFVGTTFPLTFLYDTDNINCYCRITANTVYDSCVADANLMVDGNYGTFDNLADQTAFNGAGIDARTSTVFTAGPGQGTYLSGLRSTVSSPVDQTNPPQPTAYVPVSGVDGSILWQATNNITLTHIGTKNYKIEGKVRSNGLAPMVFTNELIHLDKYTNGGLGGSAAMPYLSEYSPQNTWLKIGIRFYAINGAVVIPFARYFNNSFSNPGPVVGDLLLRDGAYLDWSEVVVKRYFPVPCIECEEKYHTVHNAECDYETVLSYTEDEPCATLKLEDVSYFDRTPGHNTADFSLYRKVTVTLPDGSQQVLSSVAPYNIHIDPAGVALNPIDASYPVSVMGYYIFTLCECPTFDNTISYQIDDCVCLYDSNGLLRFFKCLVSSPGYTPLVTIGWQVYWVEVTEDTLDPKYCDSKTYYNVCGLKNCIKEYLNKLYCQLNILCSNNYCDNPCLQNYTELLMIKYCLETLDASGEALASEWDQEDIINAFNIANRLCCQCNCK